MWFLNKQYFLGCVLVNNSAQRFLPPLFLLLPLPPFFPPLNIHNKPQRLKTKEPKDLRTQDLKNPFPSPGGVYIAHITPPPQGSYWLFPFNTFYATLKFG